jgi:hypothetical protein
VLVILVDDVGLDDHSHFAAPDQRLSFAMARH